MFRMGKYLFYMYSMFINYIMRAGWGIVLGSSQGIRVRIVRFYLFILKALIHISGHIRCFKTGLNCIVIHVAI